MKRIPKHIILIAVILFIFSQNTYSIKFDLTGKIESVRRDNIITLLFEVKPEKDNYLILEDELVVGKIVLLSVNAFSINQKTIYRALAEYSFTVKENLNIIKTGSVIGLIKEEKKEEPVTSRDELKKEKISYKKLIISEIDYREMVIIPAGKFLFGSDKGEKNEQPEQIIFLEDFYIDKYEVSNSDYLLFVKKTNAKPPVSWVNGKYNDGEDDFPVLVSYYEAVKYAEWAGKRLPSEEEWEKAARGFGIEQITQDKRIAAPVNTAIFPWGDKFDPIKANSLEFWEAKNIGDEIRKKYKKGLLPVYLFKGAGDSIFGVINMAGNAAEWTSSWYNAYKGSKHSDKLFGKQVKVIRGGAWYNQNKKLRTTNRDIGGLPNLYIDNIAGFRCVKEPTIIDESKSD